MAMNKKEKALVENLQIEIAFHRTQEIVERDVPPPETYDDNKLSRGFDFNIYAPSVYKACSSSVYNGPGWDRTNSQGSRHLYSTRVKAFKAMRRELEFRMAQKLHKLDIRHKDIVFKDLEDIQKGDTSE